MLMVDYGGGCLEWGTSGPPTSGLRYCAVYKTVEVGVEMSKFGNKVGHLDPC